MEMIKKTRYLRQIKQFLKYDHLNDD